ncbi:hypothetical protein [Allobranchiibius sp. CTAmp26]|uniref:hypothetical protein n=1 Tax=Allobranchiibius sp. CTAmp26 TaxID=2815214 RepID=UPI001AA1BB2F|nr:hypothetical protein [Allobranchiibius sp. CTAmp26]MBO1754924.1 hypothetical protein [Allobranchiibius sp. CTAmp26]
MTTLDKDPDASQGRRWLGDLPEELHRQRAMLTLLLDLCVATPSITSLSVGCSLGRGAGDALSDVDAALGVDASRGEDGAREVSGVEHAVVAALSQGQPPVGVLRDRVGPADRFVRRLFAQFRDGTQLDLAIMAEAEVRRGASAPDFVPLYVSSATSSSPARAYPPADTATAEQIHDWTFLGWSALADLDKYLQRGSAWEAHSRLHEARHRVWQLWAAANGATYPWHGLSQVLDEDPHHLPSGIDATVAGLDLVDLRRAARATADVLARVSGLAADTHDATLPTEMARYVTDRLG